MEQEKETIIPNDELTALITRRLGERQQKLQLMEQWERPTSQKARLRPLYWVTAVAACLALVVWLKPWASSSDYLEELGIGAPTMTVYRGSTAEMKEIETLISKEQYGAALEKVTKTLRESDWYLETLYDMCEAMGNDEDVYEYKAEMLENSELRWTRIFLLLKTGQEKEASKEVKRYLRNPDYCQHLDEAKALKKKLK